jgi:hypothetical protein
VVESTLLGQGREIKEGTPAFPRLVICYLRDLDSQDHQIGVVRLPKGSKAEAAIETAAQAYKLGPVSDNRELFTFIVRDGEFGRALKEQVESLNQGEDTLITIEEIDFIVDEVNRLLKREGQGSSAQKTRS